MNSYLNYVESIANGIEQAASIAVPDVSAVSKSVIKRDRKVLLFSPHPDDECITGLLPMRLQHEHDYQIVNVPMTFGSNPARRKGRLTELENACAYLGWENYQARKDLENLTMDDVIQVLLEYRPEVIVFPHDADWNSRHIEVHHILMRALEEMPAVFSCLVVETEFWGAMENPNIHVEASIEQVSELLTATAFHIEEVARNPYHLRLPAWMQDNVRRGAELVGGQGESAPAFQFSTLYRLRFWDKGNLVPLFDKGQIIPSGSENLNMIKQWKLS